MSLVNKKAIAQSVLWILVDDLNQKEFGEYISFIEETIRDLKKTLAGIYT